MKKLLLLLFITTLISTSVKSQNKINRYEYWFDNDFASHVATSLTPAAIVNINTDIPTTGLSMGLHTINIRFKDDSVGYSSVLSSFFIKLDASASASHNMSSYEYWFDNDYTGKTSGGLSGVQATLTSSISTTSLAQGLHTFNIRFKDNTGLWSAVSSQFFFKQNNAASSPTAKMSAYEYWFDNNYGAKVQTAMAGNTSEQVLTDINAAALADGLHTLNIRFKDTQGMWSSALSQFFFKQAAAGSVSSAVLTSYEYWYDNDYANKTSTAMAGTASQQVVSALPTTTLSSGLHTVNLRFKDNSGKWSSTISQFFFKQQNSLSVTPQLVKYEYWYDNNYAGKVSASMNGNQTQTLITGLTTTTLSAGLHTVNIRFADAQGMWSTTLSQFFFKQGTQTNAANNLVTGYRYWFDTTYSKVTTVHLPSPVNPLSLVTSMDLTRIRKGIHELHFQFKDTLGMWSAVTTDTITKQSLLIAEFDAVKKTFCDSGVVQFTNTSVDADIYEWNLGDGTTSNDSVVSHSYYVSGSYSVTLTITDTTTHKTETLVKSNFIKISTTPVVSLGNDTAICSGSTLKLNANPASCSYLWSNSSTGTSISVSAANLYWLKSTNTDGCFSSDSITVNVNPLPSLSSTLTPSAICSSATFTYSATSATPGTSFTWSRASVSGVIEAGTSGIGDVSEVLTNTTTAVKNVTYVYISTANGCSGASQNVVVAVNPIPKINSTLSPSAICSASTFTYNVTGVPAGSSFSWNRLALSGITESASSGTGNINEVLTNTTASFINVTYTYFAEKSGCANPGQNVVVKVNPIPALSSTLSPASICSATAFSYAATSATPSTTFTWNRASITGITQVGRTGAGNVNEVLTNTTTAAINVSYVYVSKSSGCSNAGETVVVEVNPIPKLSSTITPTAICSATAFTYTANSATAATSFIWNRSSVSGIQESASSGSSDINEVLTNSTTAIVNVTYNYTSTANGCSSSAEKVILNVNPSPKLSSTLLPAAVCSGATFTYTATSATTGAVFTWNRANVVGVSEASSSGTGSINEVLTSSGLDSASATYNYTTIANGCIGAPENVVVLVIPPVKADFTIATNVLNIQLSNTSINANMYDWNFGDNAVSSDENPQHQYASGGSYTIYLTAKNSCGSDTKSSDISIISNGILNIQTDELFVIYPNPTSGIFNVGFSDNNHKTFYLMVYDGGGKLILQKAIDAPLERIISLNLTGEANGVYNVIITDEGKQVLMNKKLILEH